MGEDILETMSEEIKRPCFLILPPVLDDKWTIRLIFPAASKFKKDDDSAIIMEDECDSFEEAEEHIMKMIERMKQYGVYYLKVEKNEI